MRADVVDAAVCGSFRGNRKGEDLLGDAGQSNRRRRDRDEGVYVDGPVVIGGLERRAVWDVMIRGPVSGPMDMRPSTIVMVRHTLVGVAMDQRSANGRSL